MKEDAPVQSEPPASTPASSGFVESSYLGEFKAPVKFDCEVRQRGNLAPAMDWEASEQTQILSTVSSADCAVYTIKLCSRL